jgi:transposase InsO family protein
LGISESWLYKWIDRASSGQLTASDEHRRELDMAVKAAFEKARGLHGSPRLHADLRDAGWRVSEKTVAASMRRQRLVARRIRRRNSLTKSEKGRAPFPDLICRDFSAPAPNVRWVGDMTEIPVAEHGKLYLQTVIDLYSRRLLGAAISRHPNAPLACSAINIAVAARGGQQQIDGVIFHSDRGSVYTSDLFTNHCRSLQITQSMGRVGSCFDNACAEAFFSSLEWEVLSRTEFRSLHHAEAVVLDWCYGFYNHTRRHTHNQLLSPIAFEQQTQAQAA